MANPSRETFDASKQYRGIRFINDRYVPDSSLNELQSIGQAELERFGDSLYNQNAILNGCDVTLPGSGQLSVDNGELWAFGRVETIPGLTLAYDPAKVTGVDTVFARWTLSLITQAEDTSLTHVFTGEAIDERLRARAQLLAVSTHVFDENFERWQDGVPVTWTLVSGQSAIGYPAKFGARCLELRHTTGTETRIERTLTLPVSTSLFVYFWVRAQDTYTPLSLAHGAYVDFERSSPAWFPADFPFATTNQWTRIAATVTSDTNADSVKLRIVIPAGAPTTRMLIDGLLVSTTALTANELEQHDIPLFAWDRATNEVTRFVDRSARLRMRDLVPPLAGTDIEGIERNQGLIEVMARRSYLENGHYRIPPGLRIRRDTTRDTSTHLGVLGMPGWGYVRGYECKVSASEELLISKALSFDTVTGENDAFAFGTNIYGLNKAEGEVVYPIKEITLLQVTREQVVSVTKGTDGSVDDTGVSAVSSIQGVSAGTAGTLVGTATTFTFTEAAQSFVVSVSPYAGGAVGAAQTINFSRGTYTIAQVLEALNSGSGPAYRLGKIVGNVIFDNDGSGHVRVKTKTLSNASTVTLGSGTANTILGFTNGATNTGTGTHYAETTSWVRSGNSVDWVTAAPQPGTGNSYSVVVRNTETLTLSTDFLLGGAFGSAFTYKYVVTAVVSATEGLPGPVATRVTPIGGINKIAWSAVGSAQSYGVYRSDDGGTVYRLLKFVDGTLVSFLDDGTFTPNASVNPPGSGSAGPTVTTATASNVGVVNLHPVGKMPVDGTNLVATYTYYQPYIGYVCLNQQSQFLVIEGVPGDVPSPPAIPIQVMELAQIFVNANSTTLGILDLKKYDRVPQVDLRVMVDRVNTLQIDNLRQLIYNELRNRGDGATHKGRVAEGFSDEKGTDFSYSASGVTTNIGIHPALQFAGMPQTYTQPALVVNTGNTTAIKKEEEYVLPSTEAGIISQPRYSESLSINPYLGTRVPLASVSVFPRSMSWAFKLNASITPQQRTARANTLFAALWRKLARFLPPWNADAEGIQQEAQSAIRKGLTTEYPFETEPITITVDGEGFHVAGTGDTNIWGTFAGIPVDLTPISPTTAGSLVGGKTTVNADSAGRWRATCIIPNAVSAGTDDFLARSASHVARATFTSLGSGGGSTSIVLEPPLPEITLYDPLAQSIGPWITDKTLSAIQLTFIHPGTPAKVYPVHLQIRTMENGFPTRTALMTMTIAPSEITWNLPSTASWVSTKINFRRPLFIPKGTQVAVALLTVDSRYQVATATYGKTDHTGVKIGNNPYPLGVLFTSSNGATWTSLQETDLRMVVFELTYTSPAVLEFNGVSPSAVSRLWLAADQFVPENTTVKWEYVLNGGATLPISPFTKIRPPLIPTSIVVRARLSTGNVGVSPRVMLPTTALIGTQRSTTGTWVSSAVTFTQTLSNALMTVTAHIPATATVTWYVSRDDGAVWTAMGAPTDTVDQDLYWKEYQWNTPVALGGSAVVKKLRVRAELTIGSHLSYGPMIAKIGVALT